MKIIIAWGILLLISSCAYTVRNGESKNEEIVKSSEKFPTKIFFSYKINGNLLKEEDYEPIQLKEELMQSLQRHRCNAVNIEYKVPNSSEKGLSIEFYTDSDKNFGSWKSYASVLSLGLIPVKYKASHGIRAFYEGKILEDRKDYDVWVHLFLSTLIFSKSQLSMWVDDNAKFSDRVARKICSFK